MKAADLRIGNLVNYTDDTCVCTISELYSKQVGVDVITHFRVFPPNPVSIVNIGGIRLTDYWMKLLGFSKNGAVWEETFHLPGMFINREGNSFYLQSDTNNYINKEPLSFVHEIQNLYHAITRKDIETDTDKIEIALNDSYLKL